MSEFPFRKLAPWLRGAMTLALLMTLAPLAAAEPVTRLVRDDTGETVTVAADSCRIVSLAPGTTAMLYAAGAGGCLIGTIAHSTEPAEAAAVKVVGDAETLDFEQLLALRPSVVVVAVDVVQRVRIDRLRQLGIPVYQVHVTRLAGMPESLRRLGALTGTSAVADAKAAELEKDLDSLRSRFARRKTLRVLYQIWDQPIYTIGGRHVISDALTLCGASNIFDDLATAAPAVTREAVLARDPQLIIASAPPDPAKAWLDQWRRFGSMTAVRGGHLVAYSDERIDRMGPSVIAATANLCSVIDAARSDIEKSPPAP
jgi:iron complex transport system substrate-binding protein